MTITPFDKSHRLPKWAPYLKRSGIERSNLVFEQATRWIKRDLPRYLKAEKAEGRDMYTLEIYSPASVSIFRWVLVEIWLFRSKMAPQQIGFCFLGFSRKSDYCSGDWRPPWGICCFNSNWQEKLDRCVCCNWVLISFCYFCRIVFLNPLLFRSFLG